MCKLYSFIHSIDRSLGYLISLTEQAGLAERHIRANYKLLEGLCKWFMNMLLHGNARVIGRSGWQIHAKSLDCRSNIQNPD
jgi:hypothetical protein